MDATRTLAVLSALGSGLCAGVYFAFTTFVMPGLRRLPAPEAIRAMNGVNRAAPASALLMLALFGTGLLCLATAVTGLTADAGTAERALLLAGCLLYLVSLVLTAAYHVPRNNALVAYDPAAHAAGAVDTRWREFLSGWLPWNHVRALTALAGAAAFTASLRTGR